MNGAGPFARYSMAGWVLLVVLLASIAFSPDQTAFNALKQFLVNSATTATVSGVITAAFGLIFGVSAPPAVGYVLARSASVTLELIARNWHWEGWSKRPTRRRVSAGDLGRIHAEFYSRAPDQLIAWWHDRSDQVGASSSCALAALSGLLIAGFVYHAWSPWIWPVVILISAALIADALVAFANQTEARRAWDATQELKKKLN